MTNVLLAIYKYFEEHTILLRLLLFVIIVCSALLVSRVTLIEDISSFLPQSKENEKIQFAYQHIGAANTLMVSVSSDSADEYAIIDAVDFFVDELQKRDSLHRVENIFYQVDQQQIMEVGQFVIENMPLYLNDADYERLEQSLSGDSITARLNADKQLLLSPMGGVMKNFIALDPLAFATPLLQSLNQSNPSSNYETIDGYIFDKDGKEAIVAVSSRFPVSETSENASLIFDIEQAMQETMKNNADVKLDCIGASAISIGNAQRIKMDSIISTAIALIFILALLLYFFRDVRALAIIIFSISFGALFGMAFVSLFKESVSVIAIGVGSIIVGIAVNYPLHFLAHYQQGYSKEQTIRDIIDPLVTGNLTTVGAFLSLVFIHSNAMKDLGLFASFLLVGTILFVLIFLPHLFKKNLFVKQERLSTNLTFNKIASYNLDRNTVVVVAVILITIPLYFFSKNTSFDSDLHSINYMTDSQREKMAKINAQTQQDKPTFFCVAEGETVESALQNYEAILLTIDSLKQDGLATSVSGIASFIPSKKVQEQRLKKWNEFVAKHRDTLLINLENACRENGFNSHAFKQFENILCSEYSTQDVSHFEPIMQSIGRNFIYADSSKALIYTIIGTEKEQRELAEKRLNINNSDIYTFDNTSLVTQMVSALSDDFDYVLYVCGLIVFFFLTFSFGRLELSLISFVPLAIGWIWILGLMDIFDMKFNIVNIILATFIFGQGDDYTIFVTEGMMYEYTYRKKMLASYKNSVCLSATIMFIGIGSLILAKHPAMHSLGEVTIVGMFSVVLMAYLFPPLLYRWLTQKNGKDRLIPITIKNLFTTVISFIVFLIGSLYLTLAGFVSLTILGKTPAHKLWFHKRLCGTFRFLVKIIPGVRFDLQNVAQETFEKPGIIIANHQSHLDLMYLLLLNPKIICLTNHWVWRCPFYGWIIRYADFYPVENGIEDNVETLRKVIDNGYSILVFPEGTRSENCDILRFHKGAFYLARQLHVDIIPTLIHGVGHVFPKTEFLLRKGKVTVKVLPRITTENELYGEDVECRDFAKAVRRQYVQEYEQLANEVETAEYYKDLVLHNYIYKSRQIEQQARKVLNSPDLYERINALPNEGTYTIENCGQGEFALLAALVKKSLQIVATDSDENNIAIAKNCISVPGNLKYEIK